MNEHDDKARVDQPRQDDGRAPVAGDGTSQGLSGQPASQPPWAQQQPAQQQPWPQQQTQPPWAQQQPPQQQPWPQQQTQPPWAQQQPAQQQPWPQQQTQPPWAQQQPAQQQPAQQPAQQQTQPPWAQQQPAQQQPAQQPGPDHHAQPHVGAAYGGQPWPQPQPPNASGAPQGYPPAGYGQPWPQQPGAPWGYAAQPAPGARRSEQNDHDTNHPDPESWMRPQDAGGWQPGAPGHGAPGHGAMTHLAQGAPASPHLAQQAWINSPEKKLQDLSDDGQTALLIVGGSWFIGLPFIGGPLGWAMAARVRREFIAMGVEPPTMTKAAIWLGAITTLLFAAGLLLIPLILLAVFLV